jgi:uncharacterized protein
MNKTIFIFLLLLMGTSWGFAVELTHDYPIQPVSFTQVQLQDTFWLPRIETNRKVTIPYAFKQCEETGRIDNFAIAGGLKKGEHRGGFPFDDTDPYKILEGASYTLSVQPDPKLEKYLDDLIVKIAAAQEDDGYLYTCRTNQSERLRNWMGDKRWSKLAGSHELYNPGHMYEAAVAHFLATGKRSFLDVAAKNADLIDKTFGPGKLQLPPGHQIIEMGLARLYRATGNEKYLQLAKYFLDIRGWEVNGRKLYGPYSQDHKPVTEQDEAVGHAVRATYMYAGMADIAALTGDEAYLKAIDRIWDNVVSKKLYLTGGVGATGHGEAFGKNYELPNESAYCETCAAIGNVYWNHRLFLLHGHAKYIDVMERTLYNGLISGVSLDGKLFFYPNPLASHGQHSRSPWFGCACCPGNMTRFIASVPGYMYASIDDAVYVNLFAEGTAKVPLKNNTVTLRQQTAYPWQGTIHIIVEPQQVQEFTINLRIPGWAQNQPVPSDLYRFLYPYPKIPSLQVNGKKHNVTIKNGYAQIKRKWNSGDSISLTLPMPVRRVIAHEKVEADRGRVALTRGPLLYCIEWPDVKSKHVHNLILADDVPLQTEFREKMVADSGMQLIHGAAVAAKRGKDGQSLIKTTEDFTAIPYYAWAHRGKGDMAVWLPRSDKSVEAIPADTIASTSQVSTSFQSHTQNARLTAVNDQRRPKNSGDEAGGFFHWWPHQGTTEWIQYDFQQKENVSRVEVYWFDDTGRGNCRNPESWRVLYKDAEQWKPVNNPSAYETKLNRLNTLTFDPVETTALRLEVKLKPKFSTGVIEWTVK